MTDTDYESFMHEFRRVASAFERYPQSLDQIRSRADVYFQVLRKYPIELVTAKADRWIEHETKMPKPAEWANQIAPKHRDVSLDTMRKDEALEWLRAERQHWEDEPCACSECQRCAVAELPRRFVPLFDRNDNEIKRLCFERLVTAGEWIHGEALMRWYLAREKFFAALQTTPIRTMPHVDTGLPNAAPRHSDPDDFSQRLLGERE